MSKITHGGILLNTFSLASKTIRLCKLKEERKKKLLSFTQHSPPLVVFPFVYPPPPPTPLSHSPYFPISRGKAGKAVSFKYRCVKLPILATQSGILHNKIIDLLTQQCCHDNTYLNKGLQLISRTLNDRQN